MTDHPDTGATDWQGRLPAVDAGPMDDEQARADEYFRGGAAVWAERNGFAATDADGHLIGPFNALVRRPRHGRAYQNYVVADQENSSLPATIREVVILTVGVAWEAAYEVYAHVAVARSVGLSEAVIDGLRAHEAGDAFSPEELAAHRFVDELVRTHRVRDETYRAAEELFGADGVQDVVFLTGMYLGTSALLNAFEIPAPGIPPR